MDALQDYLQGALTMASFMIGLKFLKYWRVSKDRFFVYFATAFWVFGLGWGFRTFYAASDEHAYLVFLPRLLAFLLILFAIYDKNRRASA